MLGVRLPRVLLGLLVGCGLACSGAVFQGVLRNPLADPFILGTSSAATFGVMLANLLGWKEYYLLYFMALGCALLSIAFVYQIAMSNGRTSVQTVVLSGVVVSLFLNAVVFIFFSLFHRESFTILFYLLGTLSNVDIRLVAISGVIIAASFLVCWFFGKRSECIDSRGGGGFPSRNGSGDRPKNFFCGGLFYDGSLCGSGGE